MATVFVDTGSIPKTAPIQLNFHVVTTLNVTAEDARRQVNRRVVTDLGTGLIARDPELVIAGEQIIWRVPIVLSLPDLGDLGQVGAVDVNAQTGDLLTNAATQERIIQHAHQLYLSATSQIQYSSCPAGLHENALAGPQSGSPGVDCGPRRAAAFRR